MYGTCHRDIYLQSHNWIRAVHNMVLDSFTYIHTISSPPGENATLYASSSSTCHKQQPIRHPFLCVDNDGVVYSSKFLSLAGRKLHDMNVRWLRNFLERRHHSGCQPIVKKSTIMYNEYKSFLGNICYI